MTAASKLFSAMTPPAHRRHRHLALSFTLILALCSCSKQLPEEQVAPEQTTLAVMVSELKAQPWAPVIDSFGRLESTEAVNIAVDFSGIISKINFQEGQTIKAGQLLIQMDRQKQKLRLQQAEADVASASAQLERAHSTFQRHRSLLSSDVLSQEQYKRSEADFESAKAALDQAKAQRALAKRNLQETSIISPVDGVVKQRVVEPGQTVLPGQTLAVVQVTDTMRLVTYVTEKEVNSLNVGDTAPLASPGVPGRTYQGRIETVASSADPRTGNFTIKLTVNNKDGLLREGMSARVRLEGARHENTLLIPRQVLVDRDRKRVVFRLKDGKAEMVEPVLSIGDGVHIAVLSGLAAGDQIITSHLELITQGTQVTALPSEGEQP